MYELVKLQVCMDSCNNICRSTGTTELGYQQAAVDYSSLIM